MVLIRSLWVLLLAAGCNVSLFDAGPRDPSGDDDSEFPTECPDECIADAAADFGAGDPPWRYFDDNANLTWTPMSGTTVKVGTDPSDHIESCASDPEGDACSGLRGALLIASGGEATGPDPSLAFTATAPGVLRLDVIAFVPRSGGTQKIRLYRNSRQDVLATAIVAPGDTQALRRTVPALPGDRFFVAVDPEGGGGGYAAVQFFISRPPGEDFPSTCELALSFALDTTMASNVVEDLCRSMGVGHYSYPNDDPAPPALTSGPFTEQGTAANIAPSYFFKAEEPVIPTRADFTVQLWMRRISSLPEAGWVFSNLNVDTGGGVGVSIYDSPFARLEISVVDPPNSRLQSAMYPSDNEWHFLRVVYTDARFDVCLDGEPLMSMPYEGSLDSGYPLHLGKNVDWSPYGAFYNGDIDDVRVFSEALPCEPSESARVGRPLR